MAKLEIVPPSNVSGPVVSSQALRVGANGIPEKSNETFQRAKERLHEIVEAEQKRASPARTVKARSRASSTIASMSSIIKETGPFGPIASVFVPVLAASFAVYLYMSASSNGVEVKGEARSRSLFRWLDVIIGVIVASAILSFAR